MPLSEKTVGKFKQELILLLNKYEHLGLGVIAVDLSVAEVLDKVVSKLEVIKLPLSGGYDREPRRELSADGRALFADILKVQQDMASILAYYHALKNEFAQALEYSKIATDTGEATRKHHHALLLTVVGAEPDTSGTVKAMMRAESFRFAHNAVAASSKDDDGRGEMLNNMGVFYIPVAKAQGLPEYEYLTEAIFLFDEAMAAGNTEAATNKALTEIRLTNVLFTLEEQALTGNTDAQGDLGQAYKLLMEKGNNTEALRKLQERLTEAGKRGVDTGPITWLRVLSILHPLESGTAVRLTVRRELVSDTASAATAFAASAKAASSVVKSTEYQIL